MPGLWASPKLKPIQLCTPPPHTHRPLSGQPPGTAARGARAVGWADLSPQLPPSSPLKVSRWLEVPVDGAGGKGDRVPGMLLREEVRGVGCDVYVYDV